MLSNPVNVVLRIEKELLEAATVALPPNTSQAAKVSAREQGVSLSHVMRASLRRFVGGRTKPRPRKSRQS